MNDWGRKFKSGLFSMLIVLLLFLAGKISENTFSAMELAFAGMLFGANVGSKLATRFGKRGE